MPCHKCNEPIRDGLYLIFNEGENYCLKCCNDSEHIEVMVIGTYRPHGTKKESVKCFRAIAKAKKEGWKYQMVSKDSRPSFKRNVYIGYKWAVEMEG
jgi:hypothetical protein